ncbi:midkine b isoform X1 [Dicentrarchus labrax]|uniref:Midkine n=1 Tax=Dicentrarchus labrax TaxID=13489 RepID=A0A8C4EB70_DICLA|nr:midkine b isoform X1 [Dicentrarchus labrax]
MRSLFSVTLLLLLALTLTAEANKRVKGHKAAGKHEKRPASECSADDTRYGKCIPNDGDCGEGERESTCKDRTEQIPCKIPCNWKKAISDCKYKFGPWGSCDAVSNTKSRSGTLKRALFNANCDNTVKVSKPCSPKVKKTRGDKKSN